MGTRQLDRQLDLLGARLWNRPRRLAAASELADHLSFRRLDRFLHYRVHHMFLDAPREVVHALASFAGSGRGMAARRRQAGERIDAYVREHRARIADPRPGRLDPRGRVHDLKTIFDRLNAVNFGGLVDARIGWGPNRGRGRRRTIKTGVYVQDARLIRIHPALDRPQVPEHYVAAVVFHEMLHQVIPIVEKNGRRVVHGPEFRRRERQYPEYERAKRWEEENLSFLLEA